MCCGALFPFTTLFRSYERALAIKEKMLGPDHPSVATGLAGLASLLKDQVCCGASFVLQIFLCVDQLFLCSFTLCTLLLRASWLRPSHCFPARWSFTRT